MENTRNPTQRLTVREALKQDITDALLAANQRSADQNYNGAIRKKDEADTLFRWGMRRGLLDEDDRITFYGNRHLKGGKEEYTPGIFPEEAEAKCRAKVDWEEIQQEVKRRIENLLSRAKTPEMHGELLRIYQQMPEGK